MLNTGLKGKEMVCYDYFDFLDFLGRTPENNLGNDFDDVVIDSGSYRNDSYISFVFSKPVWKDEDYHRVVEAVLSKSGLREGQEILFWVSW